MTSSPLAREDRAPASAGETPTAGPDRPRAVAVCPVGPGAARTQPAFRSHRAADRAMRALLRIREPAPRA